MSVFNDAAIAIQSFAQHVPLELYTGIASFIEEVIAPIPSPFVMTSAGSIAEAQGKAVFYLLILAVIGAIGKTLGAWLLYFVADKFEDVIITKYGRFFGVTHRELESIGKHFKGHWKDTFVLMGLRALPIIPSAPISIVCGAIKVSLKSYLIATFLGTIVRNMIFLYFGFAGLSSYENIVHGLESVESFVQVFLAAFVGLFIVWMYWKRHRNSKDHS
jgi:membrane protein DedA with SNARE-associated domain